MSDGNEFNPPSPSLSLGALGDFRKPAPEARVSGRLHGDDVPPKPVGYPEMLQVQKDALRERAEAAAHVFPQFMAALADAVPEAVFMIWFEGITAVDLHERKLTVQAPVSHVAWMADRFRRVMDSAAAKVLGDGATVEVQPRP